MSDVLCQKGASKNAVTFLVNSSLLRHYDIPFKPDENIVKSGEFYFPIKNICLSYKFHCTVVPTFHSIFHGTMEQV